MPEASGCTFMAGNSRFQETGVIYFCHLWCTTKYYLTATFCVSRRKVYLLASGGYPEPVTWQWFTRSNQTFYSAVLLITFATKSGSGNAENKNDGLMPKMWLLMPVVVRIKQPTCFKHGKSVCLSRNLWRQLVSDVTLVLPTEKYHYPRQVYVARDPGCCEVVSGASCRSRGKCSSGPSIHQKPAIWRLWVDISLLHLGTRQLLFPLGCCVGLGLWWQCVVNFVPGEVCGFTTICSVQHCSSRHFRPWPCQVQLHVKAIDMYSF